jgi:hypothetical protein
MTFPYPTVSSWFEENGDFEENRVSGGFRRVDPTVDEPVCEVCGADNPARTKNDRGTLMCEPCIDDEIEEQQRALDLADFEPCCRAVTQRLGMMGDHEWGCPNY